MFSPSLQELVQMSSLRGECILTWVEQDNNVLKAKKTGEPCRFEGIRGILVAENGTLSGPAQFHGLPPSVDQQNNNLHFNREWYRSPDETRIRRIRVSMFDPLKNTQTDHRFSKVLPRSYYQSYNLSSHKLPATLRGSSVVPKKRRLEWPVVGE
jgi:hypothetical protein